MQIRYKVFYLLAVVELQPADYDIRYALLHEPFLEQPRLCVRAVEYRNLIVAKTFLLHEPPNLSRHGSRLLSVAVAVGKDNLIAEVVLSPKIFGLAVNVVPNNFVSRV